MQSETLPEIDTRSEEVQEIVSHVPGWLSRWGITLIFLLFASLLAMSWFIKYPDTIKASVIITTSPPPFTLSSRSAGNISLTIRDNAKVAKDAVIAFLSSNARPEHVLLIEQQIMSGEHASPHALRELSLGDLQPLYASYLNATLELEIFLALDIANQQIAHLSRQEKSYLTLNKALMAQFGLATREMALAYGRFKRDSILAEQKVLSTQDYEAAETKYVQEMRNHKNTESSLINNEIQIDQIKKQKNDLALQKLERHTVLNQNLQNARSELLARILKWKETFLFISPIEGTVAYLDFLETNTFIEQGTPLFAVIPHSKQIFAQAKIPISGSGKVKKGQQVNIRLENYPYEQFGMLRGEIMELSELPSDKNYLAKIALPESLVTTYKKTLPFKQQLQGETEIITEDLRVLERVFYQFRRLMVNTTD
ncbi:MAG TPA: HlyD family efflux transporter periplasmic adaptor subunit [Chryseosolibacter sp.]